MLSAVLLEATEGSPLDPDVAAHAASCLACQATLARHRRLARLLGELRHDDVAMPPSLLTDVLDAVGRAAARSALRASHSRHHSRSALALSVAAGLVAAIVAVDRLRSRPRRLARCQFETRSPT
jgi:hypothetical protein